VLAMRIYFRRPLLEVGDFEQGRSNNLRRERSDTMREKDLPAAKRRSELIVLPPYLGKLVGGKNVHCTLHQQCPIVGHFLIETALRIILTSHNGRDVSVCGGASLRVAGCAR
jgi:hypothetical protein